jgi:PAS domain S-box-containing protein
MAAPSSKTTSLQRENDRLRAELDALRLSEARFRRLHETRIDGFARVSMDGRIQEVNQLFCRMVGYSQDELLLMTYRDLTPEKWHAAEEEIIQGQVLATGQSERYEKEYRRKDGTVFPVELQSFLVPGAGDEAPGIAAVVRDISERKAAEAALKEAEQTWRDLSVRLISAQEAERSRFARELHDDFSQRLALLAVNLHLLRQTLPADATVLRGSVNDLYAQVQSLARDMRRMSHDLHPARLEQLGLVSAIHGLCDELSSAHGVTIRLDTQGASRDVPDVVALCLYRVAQEALQNVIKHSGAAAAVVELTTCEGELRLVVADEGRGFDAGAPQSAHGVGLASIRERVRAIAGRFAVDSGVGRGTRVEVRAPVDLRGPGIEEVREPA